MTSVNWALHGPEAAKLWKQGKSMSEIAAAIPGATRNAVCGWLSRTGLIRFDRPKREPKVKPATVSKPVFDRSKREPKVKPAPVSKPVFAPKTAVPGPVPAPRATGEKGSPLVDMALDQCRYAVGTDDEGRHLFCAAPTKGVTTPFCAFHAALVYTRPQTAAERRLAAEIVAASRRSGRLSGRASGRAS